MSLKHAFLWFLIHGQVVITVTLLSILLPDSHQWMLIPVVLGSYFNLGLIMIIKEDRIKDLHRQYSKSVKELIKS